MGRKKYFPELTQERLLEIVERHKAGESFFSLARQYHVGFTRLERALADLNLPDYDFEEVEKRNKQKKKRMRIEDRIVNYRIRVRYELMNFLIKKGFSKEEILQFFDELNEEGIVT